MTTAAAAKHTRKLVAIAPDGTELTRRTHRAYTHVIVSQLQYAVTTPDGVTHPAGEWCDQSWHSSYDLAASTLKHNHNPTAIIITCQEATAMTTTTAKTRKPTARKAPAAKKAPARKPAAARKATAKPAAATTEPTSTALVPGTDPHVAEFITAQRTAKPTIGVAAMLAAYRTSGASCSQERFRSIAKGLS